MKFTWDPGKAASNLKKHDVSFEEAITAFGDPLSKMVSDAIHDERTLLIGVSNLGRLLLIVWFERTEEETRIISARKVTSHERRLYEEGE